MSHASHFLLADLGDILQNVMPVIFVILYGIAHLVGNIQQEAKKKAARPQPVEPPPKDFGMPAAAQPVAPAGNQPTLEETLRREVEEFLRKAQGGQPQPAKRQPPQKPQQRQRSQQRGEGQRPQPVQQRSQAKRSPEPAARRLVESQSAEPATPVAPLTDSRPLASPTPFGAGVALHSQTLAEHAKSLGSQVALADERMQQHLSQKFTHQLGALATATPTERRAAAIEGSMAKELQTMLANPNSVRQLIIAGEILHRPEERWQ